MLEVKAHSQLKDFLSHQQDYHYQWKHHLTMARMVARGLRLNRSTIIQTGVTHQEYLISYLIPVLLCDSPVIIVTAQKKSEQLVTDKISFFEAYFRNKNQSTWHESDNFNHQNKSSVIVMNYHTWLEKVANNLLNDKYTTIIAEAQHLPRKINEYLNQEITSQQWYLLATDIPTKQDIIRDKLARLTQLIYAHPPNPEDSYLLDEEELVIINQIVDLIENQSQPNIYQQQFIQFRQKLASYPHYISYFQLDRSQGSFSLKVSPLELQSLVSQFWKNNQLILLANYLETAKYPLNYARQLGLDLDKFTCLKFTPNSNHHSLKIYSPTNIPFPNNPNFFLHLNQEILALVSAMKVNHNPIVVITNDLPLQGQITANLAANFGSRVQLNQKTITRNTILVCDTEFWLNYQPEIYSPQLLIIATLPIPTVENPLVSAQVSYYKQKKKDWFRLYLLPTTIKIMLEAITSLRQNNGVLALFDNRVNHRSYGTKILQSLEPYAKINYLDLDWLN